MRRMIRTVVGVVLGVAAMSAAVVAQSQKLGAPVTVPKPTTVKELYAAPEQFVGKTIRVDGVITAVCEMEGCWVAVRDGSDGPNTDQTVRFQAEHDGKLVFPITSKGQAGSFQGEFVKIGANDHEAKEAAGEHAHGASKAAASFGSRYQIKVTGAVVTLK